jgi:hypothetical protein
MNFLKYCEINLWLSDNMTPDKYLKLKELKVRAYDSFIFVKWIGASLKEYIS